MSEPRFEYRDSREDIKAGERETELKEYLRGLKWEILDILPSGRLEELRNEIIEEIINNYEDRI